MSSLARFCTSAFFTVAAILACGPADAGRYHTIYSFLGGSNGAFTFSNLTQVGTLLYGTTWYGGGTGCGEGCGTVFALNPWTRAERVVYAFKGGRDGALPVTGLINVGGILYGTTTFGGRGCKDAELPGCGVVFSVNPRTGAEKVVYAFKGGSNGQFIASGVINVAGTLYGAVGGGEAGQGYVFAVDAATGAEKSVYSFQGGSDGAGPSPLVDVGGMLYGTTFLGGSTGCNGSGCGTLFELNPQTGSKKILHVFQGGSDAAAPETALIDVGGTLYGTSLFGGTTSCNGNENGCGTVFSVNINTGAENFVYAFQGGSDGANPDASLTAVGGKLYGTTTDGGAPGDGTIFEVDSRTGAERVVHRCRVQRPGGYSPESSLTDIAGTLYGTTYLGGAFGEGTVFAINP